MRYGAHLPVLDFGEGVPFALPDLKEYARSAERLGYETLTVNDHYVFSRPWLDGPTALAAVLGETRDIRLGTSVALPVVRGPVALANGLRRKTMSDVELADRSGQELPVGGCPAESGQTSERVGPAIYVGTPCSGSPRSRIRPSIGPASGYSSWCAMPTWDSPSAVAAASVTNR
jgi:hypothetical protein